MRRSGKVAAPYWSPDGSWLAFQVIAGREADIYVVGATGGEARRLTSHPARDVQPTVSRDGRWVYFGSNRSGEYSIWRIPAEGGEADQVTAGGGDRFALESLDGKKLYYSDSESLWSRRIDGGPPTLELRPFLINMDWAIGPSGMYFKTRAKAGTVDFYDFGSRSANTVMEFDEDTYTGFSLAPDGESILYVRGAPVEADIMITQRFR